MDDEKLEREAAKMIFSAPADAAEEEVVRAEPQGPEIPFTCPFCDDSYLVSAELAGKKINCRSCREPCRVDEPKATPAVWFHGGSFWLGMAVGVALTAAGVAVLHLLRLI
jgi:hypothetical protein